MLSLSLTHTHTHTRLHLYTLMYPQTQQSYLTGKKSEKFRLFSHEGCVSYRSQQTSTYNSVVSFACLFIASLSITVHNLVDYVLVLG